MDGRRVCVHAHFYQPPRENPWLGEIEREDSAAPFHDWNRRVAEECYLPAASSGLLGRLSFNAGPTLLDWMERRLPALYKRFIDADRAGGGGRALAQPYYHAILPLASRRDKETLVRWGLADFRARFGRDARGMWLPETAVDDDTLDTLAAEGVEFTVLDPAQAAATRPPEGDWLQADERTLDPKLPYRWTSPKNPSRRLAIFFYQRRLSREIVSGEALTDPDRLAAEILRRFRGGGAAELATLACDGEFYGHHHKRGDEVLARALDALEREGVEITTFERALDLFAPPSEARVRERTSWSCEHGLGRWEGDCGCRLSPDTSQAWRGPLRAALDALARRLDGFYEDDASRFFADPWALRDQSIALARVRADEERRAWLQERAKRPLSAAETARALRLLALQRERLAMFTSCGWFFDDVSGIETVQILQRAARACDLAQSLGEQVEDALIERLALAPSNSARLRDGAGVYRKLAAPARVTLARAAAHAAIVDHLELGRAGAPALRLELGRARRARKAGLAGRVAGLSTRAARVERPASGECAKFTAVVHRDDALDFACWIVPEDGPIVDAAELEADFLRLDARGLRAALDARLGPSRFGLDAVFCDERRELVRALAPAGALGHERALFLARWNEVLRALQDGGSEDDAALELLARSREHAFRPEDLPWSDALEDILHRRLDAALDADPAAVSRALRLLDGLRAAGLVRGARLLKEFAARARAAADEAAPGARRDAARVLAERLEAGATVLEVR